MRAFLDPFACSEQDRIEGSEISCADHRDWSRALVVLVAQTERDEDDEAETIDIISARRAARPERRRYEERKTVSFTLDTKSPPPLELLGKPNGRARPHCLTKSIDILGHSHR